MSGVRRAAALVLTTAAMAVPVMTGMLGGAPAGAASAVEVRASINGRTVRGSSQDHPVRISPAKPAQVLIRIVNRSGRDIRVGTLRIEGAVMGLPLFGFEALLNVPVPAGATEERTIPVDFGSVKGQAVGLLPTRVEALDASRHVIASETGVADVRGSLGSVFGLFGLGLAAFTALSLGLCLWALARNRLPANRISRALQFLTPGVGFGLTIVFTFSALRIFVPLASRWIPVLVVCSVGFFLAGYLTPARLPEPVAPPLEVDEGPSGPGTGKVVVDLAAAERIAAARLAQPAPAMAAAPGAAPAPAPVEAPAPTLPVLEDRDGGTTVVLDDLDEPLSLGPAETMRMERIADEGPESP